MLETELITCPICSSAQHSIKYRVNSFNIVECLECEFSYVNPRLTKKALINIYENEYFHNTNYGYENYEENNGLKKKNFSKWIKDAQEWMPKSSGKRVLDIGCAAGYSLDIYKSFGFVSEGIELDKTMLKHLENTSYKIFDKPILENQYDQKYAVISLFDVVEHLTDLDAHFAKFSEIIERKGVLIIVTPNYNSFQRKLKGRNWFQFKPMEHINYFTIDSLNLLAQKHGFKNVKSINSGQFVDSDFIKNRLNKYNQKSLILLFSPFLKLIKLLKINLYLDASSIYCVFIKNN
jgi:2-polyprenyl-3-methyl-5-hydroxy-6-metoxy-1,4-benzoquinol methylase